MCNNDFNVWKICLKQTDPTMRKRFAFNFLSRLLLPTPKVVPGRWELVCRRRSSTENTKKSAIIYDSFIQRQRLAGKRKVLSFHLIRMGYKILLAVGIGHNNNSKQHRTIAARYGERISEWMEERMKQHRCPVMRDLLTRFLNVYISFDMWFFSLLAFWKNSLLTLSFSGFVVSSSLPELFLGLGENSSRAPFFCRSLGVR